MVIPRSRSRSLLSITRSTTRSLDRKIPLWWSMASTRVVLPWSTWATIATFRSSGLATTGRDFTDEDILTVYRRTTDFGLQTTGASRCDDERIHRFHRFHGFLQWLVWSP